VIATGSADMNVRVFASWFMELVWAECGRQKQAEGMSDYSSTVFFLFFFLS
jgi:hypothetical protein